MALATNTLQIGSAQEIDYVFHISVDGLHSGQLENLLRTRPESYSSFQRFVTEGATTFNARTDYSSTVTLPNHTTMISGRPVKQPADDPTLHHGYLNNGQPRPTDMLHGVNPAVPYVTSTFDMVHDRGLSTALYTGKEKFVIYEQSYNVTETTNGGRPDQFLDDGNQGINKIDKYEFEVVSGTSSGIMETLLSDFQTNPFNYTFLHFLEPDSAGHAYGWRSDQWNEVVASVDQYLGQLFQLVETDPQLTGRTALVLTADHGGSLLGHSDIDAINMFRVPFFVWGPGVAAGADLYAINTLTRRDPGQLQLAYTEPWQPIRHADSANLAMSLLGLPPVEGSSINARQDLRVDLPQIATWHGSSAQQGSPGDGQTWADPRNWQRAAFQDRSPIAGDFVILPAMGQSQLIELDGARQAQTLQVDGDYQLYNGELQLVSGEITVAENQRLAIAGSLAGPLGLIKQGAGTLSVDSIVASDLLISEGLLEGPIVITGSVANRSVMVPGDVTAVQTIHGDLTQGSPGTVRLMLGADGTNSRLIVDGIMIYRGILDLNTAGQDLDPDQPGEFTRWTLMTIGRRSGSFVFVDYNGERLLFDQTSAAVSSLHAGETLFRRIEYTDKSLNWVNYRAMPGDANGDGAFDSADLVAVFAAGGYENDTAMDAGWTTGDWNGDLDFTSSDLIAAFSTGRFEQPSILAAAAASVPEPSAQAQVFLLCAVFCELMARARRFNRCRRRVVTPSSDTTANTQAPSVELAKSSAARIVRKTHIALSSSMTGDSDAA
jgi:hypothetical protein